LLEELLPAEWVAYSALTGETHLVNESSAAVLRLLDESTAKPSSMLVDALAADAEMPAAEVSAMLSGAWDNLLQAGLIRKVDQAGQQDPRADAAHCAAP
jgi:PqqD family protein of HPr-rel-A system